MTSNGTTVNYTYDAAGNVTSDGVHTYTYDSESRLVSVDGGATATYAYDHQNRRYKTTIGSSTTHYIWKDGQVLAEHNGSTGAVLVDYIYAGSQMIAKVASSTTSYILSDRLSARLTLNSSGSVVGQQGHLPFGGDFAESGSQQKQHFTSYERDSLGTDYAVNRHYASSVGRFQSADPFRPSADSTTPQSWNRYAYVMNAPVDYVDPQGLLRAEPQPGDPCGSIPEWSDQECLVTVTARPVDGTPGSFGYDHLYIKLWDTETNETDWFAAFGVGGGIGHRGGRLEGHFGLFDQKTAGIDYTAQAVMQWKERFPGSCDELYNLWVDATKTINSKNLTYWPVSGPNSNSFAYTLLKWAGFRKLIILITDWKIQCRLFYSRQPAEIT